MSVVLLILGIILFIGLVIVHEYGHFIVARRNKVEVEEFGIGFPPKAWSKKTKAGFIFSLNWLPIGGFVKLKGESDAATEPGTFGAANLWVKTKIMLAGVAMNVIVAFLLLTFLALVGLPEIIDNQFSVASDARVTQSEILAGYVEPNSPASKSDLQTGDTLISIGVGNDQQSIKSVNNLLSLTTKYEGQTVILHYSHQGRQRTGQVTLRTKQVVAASKVQEGYLGVEPATLVLKRYTWSAPIVAGGIVGQLTATIFQGLGTLISALSHGQGHVAAEQVAGPVGIVVLLKNFSLLGYQFVLTFVAIISLTLAIMNVLPIPALDGGRLFMILISRLSGRQMSREMEEKIVGASFVFLMFLIVLVTIIDIKRL